MLDMYFQGKPLGISVSRVLSPWVQALQTLATNGCLYGAKWDNPWDN
jgi:hypothetical protein